MADQNPKRDKPFFLRLGIDGACALVFTLGLCFYFRVFEGGEVKDVLQKLSDSFTAPGVLFIFGAGLVYVKRQGMFDGISYAFRYTFTALVPMFWLNREERGGKAMNYGDYREEKREKEKEHASPALPLLLSGGAFLLIGVGLFIAYLCF